MNPALNLIALQQRFVDAVLSETKVAVLDIVPGTLTADKRIGIYRHNVMATLSGALGDIYPVVKHLVGDAFFAELARAVILAHPSLSGDLNQFGAALPSFLSTYPHAAELPYLPDVARVEWACHTVFHAADTEPIVLDQFAQTLSAVPPDRLGEVVLRVQPMLTLVASKYPVGRIWELNQGELNQRELNQDDLQGAVPTEDAEQWAVDLAVAESVVVYRDGFEVVVKTVGPDAFQFLSALKAGRALGEAADMALQSAGDSGALDLQGMLAAFVQSGVIIQIECPT